MPTPADLYEENVTSAAHTLGLFRVILDDPETNAITGADPSVQNFQGPRGNVRLERDRHAVIIDIAPQAATTAGFQEHSYRLDAAAFPRSPVFQHTSTLAHGVSNHITRTIRDFGAAPSLIWYNDGRLKHGILARQIRADESLLAELEQLVEAACAGIAALLPPGRVLHRQYGAFGAPPRLCVIDPATGEIEDPAKNETRAQIQIRNAAPFLTYLPEAIFLRPDADNPNTIIVQPMAFSYQAPEDRSAAITRLASTFIRLRILAKNLAEPA